MGVSNVWIIFGTLLLIIIDSTIGNIQNRSLTNYEENSEEDQLVSSSYVLPKQIFNDGKPFYLDKDPISGQLDFSSKKPAGIEPEYNEVIDPIEKNIVLSNTSPNIHDYLNLPVKYSSSKFVYPLVSSSYANLKYQGNNKNFISNHKNHTTSTTTSPKYFTNQKMNSTKSTILLTSQTSPRPFGFMTTLKTVTKLKNHPTKQVIPTTSTTTTSKVTTTERIIETTRKPPTKIMTTKKIVTTELPTSTSTSTTTKKQLESTSTTTKLITFPSSTSIRATPSTTTIQFFPSESTSATTNLRPLQTTTETTNFRPLQNTTETTNFRPLPTSTETTNFRPLQTSTGFSTLDPADVYNVIGQKNEPNTISLADLFNTLAEDESSYPKTNQGLGSEYDLMEPISSSQPAPFAPQPTQLPLIKQKPNVSTTTEKVPEKIPEAYANDYVHYEVQKPNMNVMPYQPVSSMNNIVISPGQNSATFVLGSQQAVGTGQFVGSSNKEQMFENGQHIQYGTVISEDLAPLSQGSTNFIPPGRPQMEQTEQHPNQLLLQQQPTQELFVSSNIRFPSESISGEPNSHDIFHEIVKGESIPIDLQQNPNNQVVFPKNDEIINSNEITHPALFKPENNYATNPNQKQEILTLNQQHLQNKINFPQLPEDLTPPSEPQRERPQLRPGSSRPHLPAPAPPPFLHNEFTRKPLPTLHRSVPDRPLPNILPQFRPNAKISHGHPSYNKEPGNIRVSHHKGPYPNRPQISAPFSHRRHPIGNRYGLKMSPDSMEIANRRIYNAPPSHSYHHSHPHAHHPHAHPQMGDRMYLQQHSQQILNQMPPPKRFLDNYPVERHGPHSEQYKSSEVGVKTDRLPAFEEEDFIVNDPPKSVVNKNSETGPKLEPVVTLQMLKTQKKPINPSQEIPQQTTSNTKLALPSQSQSQSPVYVVYPVKPSGIQMDSFGSSNMEESVVVGQRGEQPPIPPSDINQMSADYQNTPFSVVRDQPQEPILMVKNKPQAQNKADFPYHLEKPDPAFAEFSKLKELERYDRDSSVHLTPRVVNRGNIISTENKLNTEIPIAIAYKPTEPTNYHFPGYHPDDKFSIPNLASPVIPEIRDTQTESTVNDEIDTRGQNYEKDFMAPFYPSMSLSGVTSSQNGWSIFPASTEHSIYEKNNINRADMKLPPNKNQDDIEITTRKFDFQPEFQSGFKPIYPPDYKIKTSDEISDDIIVENNVVMNTTVATTEIPEKRTKSKFEASIESLLFGDDEDYEVEEENNEQKAGTSS